MKYISNKLSHKCTILALSFSTISFSTHAVGIEEFQKPVTESAGINYPAPGKKSKVKEVKLEDLMSNKIKGYTPEGEGGVSAMRKEALQEVAQQMGLAAGMNYQLKLKKKDFDAQAEELDQLYDFSNPIVLIANGVLAPVLVEGNANYSKNSDDEVLISDKKYKIESRAKFVSQYPTWRTYIRFSYPTIDEIPDAYVPKNDVEKRVWDEAVKEGWTQGIRQADLSVQESYDRMVRDYKGMIKYKQLLVQGLISPTVVAKANLGVTGGGNEMDVNTQVFRIQEHSGLVPNKREWKTEYPVTSNVNRVKR